MPDTNLDANRQRAPNTEQRYLVSREDLPLCCPMPDMSVWDSHPKVYLPLESGGEVTCPYCGAVFSLRED